MVKWKKDRNVGTFIEHIESYRTTSKNGNVGFESGFVVHTLLSVVRSALEFDDQLTEEERTSVINKGFWKAAQHGSLTPSGLLASINRTLNEFKKRPSLDYVVLTNISIPRNIPLGSKRFGKVTVSFPQNLDRRFSKARNDATLRAGSITDFDDPITYRWVKVIGVSARTESSVIQKGTDCVDLLRGLWNFHYNRQSAWRISIGGKQRPVNRYIRGPFLSLHCRSGDRVSDTFYYEPNYAKVDVRPISRRDLSIMLESEQHVRGILKKHHFREFLEGVFVRYAQALDESHWELSFLKLWGLLEMLTNTANHRSYDRTIRRASFLWRDAEFSKGVLQQLREYRNRWVHKQEVTAEMEANLYSLKNHVEQLIAYHLANRFRFQSIEESCSVLDLPVDVDDLRRRRLLAELALKYRSRH